MHIDGALLRKVAKRLDATTFDIAAGLRQDELNGFLAAHYQQQSSGGNPGGAYVGNGALADLGLTYSYSVGSPIAIALAPLTDAQFSPILQGWTTKLPQISALGLAPVGVQTFADAPPPNVQLKASNITLTISATDGSINPPAVLKFSLTATGFLSVTTSGNQANVSVIPIDVRLSDPGAFRAALSELVRSLGFRENPAANSDCFPLEKLILHIANSVIAPKLSTFVAQFYFPVPIQLFSGVDISSVGIDVVDELLVVLATISRTISLAPPVSQQIALTSGTATEIREAARTALASSEQEFLKVSGITGQRLSMTTLEDAISFPNRGIFLLMSQNFFQVLADALLVTSSSTNGGGGGTIYYNWSWSIRTWNPIAKIVGNGLAISVDVQANASASVGIHTCCGTISAGVSASASATPANANTTFFFQNNSRELWMSLSPSPFTINWTIGGLPWPLNQVLATLLDIFSDLGVQFIAALGLRWKRKLTAVPQYFPGTTLQYTLSLDQTIVADQGTGALLVAGSVTFQP